MSAPLRPPQPMPVRPAPPRPHAPAARPGPLLRFVQAPVYNLSESEQHVLALLHGAGIPFRLQPRPDPSDFLTLTLRLDQGPLTAELTVDPGRGPSGSCSLLVRRAGQAEALRETLARILGPEALDRSRLAASRRYLWLTWSLPQRAARPDLRHPFPGLSREIFHFTPAEQHLLSLLAGGLERLGQDLESPLELEVMPRAARSGSLELTLIQGEVRQPALASLRGFYPMDHRLVTEARPLGPLLRRLGDLAFGPERLHLDSSRLGGRILSLVYRVHHPRALLDRFEP